MPLPTTKSELLVNLHQAYTRLDSEFDVVSKELENLREIDGSLSCCDVLSYQIGWANLLIGWEQQELDGKTPAMPAEGFKWNQLGELALSFYSQSSTKSLSELRLDFNETYMNLVSWIESLSEEELFKPHQRKWTGDKWAIVKWIQVNTIAPYSSARTKVRRWKKDNEM